MSAWRLEEATANAPQTAKRARAEGGEAVAADREVEGDKQALVILCKVGLQTQQQLRQVQAALFVTWLCPNASSLVAAATRAGVNYDAAVKAKGPGHKLGSPHTHVWAGVVDALAKDELLAGQRDFWKKIAGAAALGQAYTAMAIPHFRVKPTYGGKNKDMEVDDDKKLSKITIMIDPLHAHAVEGLEVRGVELAVKLRDALSEAIRLLGGDRKHGQAPRGQLERLLETNLKRLQKRS